MALSIHTNYASMVTQTNLNKSNNALSTHQQRLGTGLRINSAADDAAGLAKGAGDDARLQYFGFYGFSAVDVFHADYGVQLAVFQCLS